MSLDSITVGWIREKPLSREEVSAILHERRKKARFLVDESLGIGVTELLRSRGWNVKDVSEYGLSGRSDEDVVAFAFKDQRFLLTHDPDFLNSRRFPHHRFPGVVVLPGGHGNDRALLRALRSMVSIVGHAPDLFRPSRMRITEDGIWTVATYEKTEGRVVTTRYRIVRGGGLEIWEDE